MPPSGLIDAQNSLELRALVSLKYVVRRKGTKGSLIAREPTQNMAFLNSTFPLTFFVNNNGTVSQLPFANAGR